MSKPDSPRAIIHKRILDHAKANPEASIAAIADEVSGASPDLVERVLDKYGDPASEAQQADTGEPEPDQESHMHDADESMTAKNRTLNVEDLSEDQKEVISAIKQFPDATQAELADHLNVSPSTINTRVNSIEDFNWEDRREFVSELYHQEGTSYTNQSSTDLEQHIATLQEQLTDIESQIEDVEPRCRKPFQDPELLAKVVRACVTNESITEEEEIEILSKLL